MRQHQPCGIRADAREALRPGTILSLMFEDDACVEPFEVQAEIAWCQTGIGLPSRFRRAPAFAR
jgi:hypothetical protein